jgi:glycosyltransferase involved in cell wall biosynthesis
MQGKKRKIGVKILKLDNKFDVVHISSVHILKDTRIFYKECLSLKKSGFKVKLINQAKNDLEIDGISVIALPISSNRFERFTKTLFKAYKLACREKADIYHLHDPELIPLGIFLRILGRQVVYDMHENVPRQILSKKWISPIIRKPLAILVKGFERLCLNSFHVVFAETSYFRDYSWVKKNITVLNLPLVDELLRISSSPTKKGKIFRVGYIGGVTIDRGIDVCISAINELRDRGEEIIFECIGPVDKNVNSLSLWQKGIANGWIRSYGRLPAKEGWPIVANCHVGVAILKPIENYYESYPTKMFEYMAMGLPVIVSNFPLYKKVIDESHSGYAIDPMNVEHAIDALQKIINGNDKALYMSQCARKAATENYNWEAEFRKLLNLYKRVINRRDLDQI